MADRLDNPDLVEQVLANFNKKSSTNIKRLKIKFEIFSLQTNELITSGFSNSICDSSSKEHGILDFTEINVKSCCGLGGRKIFMISQGLLAQDVEPRFQLFEADGTRLESMEHLLNQPSRDITILKEMIIFIAPPQENIELIFSNNWEIKLLGVRLSDNMESSTKFSFQYFPHDFYDPCIFCAVKPDGESSSSSSLPAPISPAKPGLRKRKMEEGESKENSKMFSRSASVPVTMPQLTPIRKERAPESPCQEAIDVNPSSQTKSSRTTTLPLRTTGPEPTSSLQTKSKTVNLLHLVPISNLDRPTPGIYTSPQTVLPESPKPSDKVSVIKYHNKGLPTTEPSRKNSLKTLHNIFKAANGFKMNKRNLSPPVSPLNDLKISPSTTSTTSPQLYTHPQLTFSRSFSEPQVTLTPVTPGAERKMPELMNILTKPSKYQEKEERSCGQWHQPVINIEEDPGPLVIKIEEDD